MHHWIDSPEALAAHLAETPAVVGLDTEFIRERAYWPQLALVQIAIRGDGDRLKVLLVDPLADGIPSALAPLLADRSVTKVMHSASEDLVALGHTCGVVPSPLFDTQIAAALCGIGAGVGYQRLVEQVEGVSLAKGETRSDWLRRPLSESQLQYASDDVLHLHGLFHALDAKLGELGRREWLREDCARMVTNAQHEDSEPWPHLSVRAAQFLDGEAQHRLLRLLRWREVQARSSDRPRNWVLDNDMASTLAKTPPDSPQALRDWLQVRPKAPRKLADPLWQALVSPLDDEADAPLASTDDRNRKLLRGLQDAVGELSGELGLPAGVLASRRWLERLLDGQWPDALEGWRRTLLEPRLAPLLASGSAAAAPV